MKEIPVSIDIENEVLVHRYFFRKRTIPFSVIDEVQIMPMATILDEIGINFKTSEKTYFTKEFDSNFYKILTAFGIKEQLPKDWYMKAERGETFNFKLR